ncbi:hypothetical protein [Neisseria animalis]|uniref:Lipoprotein n=1 Tax=Neisseria animalis TaxID=492 RepID=A0A5P3MRJ3_NEIAN|nr:hypothetical protein [Neisseria animalis]QEY24204.1 hypothetical protein D0T90_06645 [Neisseria animalis]ROW32187.1 hypothetical protein CGZ60_06345 [Neisseria animalis]VEE06510.1 Uncharacterised protein [Neisseria animalis]
MRSKWQGMLAAGAVFVLAACAATTEQEAQNRTAALPVGEWQCDIHGLPDSEMTADVVLHADGTGESVSRLAMQLEPGLVWRFEIQSKSKWRMENGYYFERYAEAPKVRELPAQTQSERLMRKVAEKNESLETLRAETMEALAENDGEEISAQIIRLDKEAFVSSVGDVRLECRRA